MENFRRCVRRVLLMKFTTRENVCSNELVCHVKRSPGKQKKSELFFCEPCKKKSNIVNVFQ